MRPVCVKCGEEMRCERNNHVVEQVGTHGDYRMTFGDRYGCATCKQQVVVGFGRPIDKYEDEQRYAALTDPYRGSEDHTVIDIRR